MAVCEREVVRTAVAVLSKRQRAVQHLGPVTGGRPGHDAPGDLLAGIELEADKVELTDMGLVARIIR